MCVCVREREREREMIVYIYIYIYINSIVEDGGIWTLSIPIGYTKSINWAIRLVFSKLVFIIDYKTMPNTLRWNERINYRKGNIS